MRALVLGVLLTLFALPASAAETTVLPKGAFVLDASYMYSTLDQRWDDDRASQPLLDSIKRYEPGAGWQGTITAKPEATFHILATQLMYGVTDSLTAAVIVPMVLRTNVRTNLGWQTGDYNPQLGRRYSEQDFWAWAESMGQPKPPGEWIGNRGVMADMVLGARYKLPQFSFMKSAGLDSALALQVALPTGNPPDPEELVTVGTTAWELHSYGDVEAHLAVSRPFWKDEELEADRFVLGADVFYAILRPREYDAPRGSRNPLLLNHQPFVGDTYTIDPGNWFGGTLSLDAVPFIGPTWSTFVSGNSLETAKKFPPLLTLTLSYSYIHTNPTDWQSESPLWEWDREKLWLRGDKNALRGMVTFSFLRMGLPLQAYVNYRSQTIIPGRNTRPSNVLAGGIRLLAKFW